MRILFVGGTGRLSKDVASLALEQGNEVFLLTRGSESRKLFVNERYHMIYGDIRNKEECERKLYEYEFDVVIDFLSYDIEQLKTTLELIDGNYKQYIFISTATVYKKKVENEIISENTTELGNDKWTYALKKYECEKFLEKYFEKLTSKYTIIRPYVTYGNTRIPYPIVPFDTQKEWTLIDRIINKRGIPVFDGGKTVTTITHTKDFAKGVVGLFGNEKAYGEAFHITDSNNVVWKDVLDCIGATLGCSVNEVQLAQQDIYESIPEYESILVGDKGTEMRFDNSKISSAVDGFECNVPLADGIRDMISFYKANPKLQIIDYYWDGQIDRLLAQNGEKVVGKYNFPNTKEHLKYLRGRYKGIEIFVCSMKKIVSR